MINDKIQNSCLPAGRQNKSKFQISNIKTGVLSFGICALLLFCHLCFGIYHSSFAQVYPQRIISLGPGITEEIYLLGAGDRIIGNTIYCNRPEVAKNKEKVGTVIKINLEKIVALNPDLVLATSLTDRKQLEKLKKLKINIVEIKLAKNFQELCNNFLKLGELLDKDKEADQIIKQVKQKIDSIRMRTTLLPKPRIIVQMGARPLFVANKDYFVNDFIELAGGVNIAWNAKTGLYSREEVLRKNPDVIVIVTMGLAGEKEMEIWKKYGAVEAVKNNRIYIIDSYRLCSPTPVSFVETLEEIVKILHPQNEQKSN